MTFDVNNTLRISVLSVVALTLVTLGPLVAFAQTEKEERIRDTGSPSLEMERAESARRAREAERDQAARIEQPDYRYHRPGELYVAGFGGYTFGHSFNNAQGSGAFSGLTAPGIDLKNSGIYGA